MHARAHTQAHMQEQEGGKTRQPAPRRGAEGEARTPTHTARTHKSAHAQRARQARQRGRQGGAHQHPSGYAAKSNTVPHTQRPGTGTRPPPNTQRRSTPPGGGGGSRQPSERQPPRATGYLTKHQLARQPATTSQAHQRGSQPTQQRPQGGRFRRRRRRAVRPTNGWSGGTSAHEAGATRNAANEASLPQKSATATAAAR